MTQLITIKGITKTKSEWARYLGISLAGFCRRLNQGLSDDDLLKPKRQMRDYENHGMTNTPIYRAWSNMSLLYGADTMQDGILVNF